MAIRPDEVRVFAPAKINLFLHVTGKRADGYHDLQSLVAFASAGDSLSLAPANEFSLAIGGPFAGPLSMESDNLVLRAARALAARTGTMRGARLDLTKNLPVASGIGGGSADAAATLRGLVSLWDDSAIGEAGLLSLAAELGSDVPVCVRSETAWMEGRGELLSTAPTLPSAYLVLANPRVTVSTGDVFRRLVIKPDAAQPPRPSRFGSLEDLAAYLAQARNDLEAPALAIAPVIGQVLEALRQKDARMARMSGSGATCFALFDSPERARQAAAEIGRSKPQWWVTAAQFVSRDAAMPVRQ